MPSDARTFSIWCLLASLPGCSSPELRVTWPSATTPSRTAWVSELPKRGKADADASAGAARVQRMDFDDGIPTRAFAIVDTKTVASVAAWSETPASSLAEVRSGLEYALSYKRAYSVAVLGDSLSDPRSWGGGYLDHLRELCPESNIENFARGASMVVQMKRQFVRKVLPKAESFTHLIVWGGVNDLTNDFLPERSVENIAADLQEIYATAQAHGLVVVAITVSPWGAFKSRYNARRGGNTLLLNHFISKDNASVDVVVDAYSLLSCGDPEKLCPEYEQLTKDGLHVGLVGHRRLGEALYESAFSECL